MKRFAILRNLDPNLTREDLDSGAVESILNLAVQEVDPGEASNPHVTPVNWVRSYWEPGTSWGLCLYTGHDELSIERYHDFCEIPYVTIREVIETERAEAPALTEADGDPAFLTIEAPSDGIPHGAEAWGDLAPNWVRSYTGIDAKFVVALFQSDGIDPEDLEARALANGWTVHRIVEIRPTDYLDGDRPHEQRLGRLELLNPIGR